MSKLTREDILKLARLSRLELTDDEIENYRTEIAAILDYVEQLQAIDLDGIEPTYQVTGLRDITRPDEIMDYGTKQETLLKNAPAIQDSQFKVKRMVG